MVDPDVPELLQGYLPVAVAIRPAAMESLSRPGGSTQTLGRTAPGLGSHRSPGHVSPEASVRGGPDSIGAHTLHT